MSQSRKSRRGIDALRSLEALQLIGSGTGSQITGIVSVAASRALTPTEANLTMLEVPAGALADVNITFTGGAVQGRVYACHNLSAHAMNVGTIGAGPGTVAAGKSAMIGFDSTGNFYHLSADV